MTTFALQQTVQRLHLECSRVPAGQQVAVRAGDVIDLINGLRAAEKAQAFAEERAEAAEAQLHAEDDTVLAD